MVSSPRKIDVNAFETAVYGWKAKVERDGVG